MERSPQWDALDAMSEADVLAAALSDPDAQPLSEDQLARMRRTPRVKMIRRALKLTQEEFSARYLVPLGTLRDWEQGAAVPDEAARAYLQAIASDPHGVHRGLLSVPQAV